MLLSLALAAGAHASLLLALSPRNDVRLSGAGGRELEAINVDLVTLDGLLAARRPSSAEAAAAPATRAQPLPEGFRGADDTVASAAASRPVAAPETSAAISDDTPDEPSELAALRPGTERDSQVRPPREEPAEDRRPEAEAAPPAAPSAPAGEPGAAFAATTAAPVVPDHARAAAMAGISREYAKLIYKALAVRRPSLPRYTRGTVVIAFGLLPTGELASSRIEKSSGSAALDAAALEVLRGTRFPPAPPGLGKADLDYRIPYIFR